MSKGETSEFKGYPTFLEIKILSELTVTESAGSDEQDKWLLDVQFKRPEERQVSTAGSRRDPGTATPMSRFQSSALSISKQSTMSHHKELTSLRLTIGCYRVDAPALRPTVVRSRSPAQSLTWRRCSQ